MKHSFPKGISGEGNMPQSEMTIIAGDNWLAVLAAAAAVYAIGFLIYGLVFSGLWLRLSGYTKAQLQPHTWKMAVSPVMPILTAIGLAILFKLARVDNLAMGVLLAVQVWFFIVLSTRLYSFVYSPEKAGLLIMDAVHLLLGYIAAGAIIGGWR
jgi:purine-cytosine permease-like protein